MKISFQESERTNEFHPIHCPHCGERVRNVVLMPGCSVEGLGIQCKRCRKRKVVSASDKRATPSKV